MKQAQEQEQRAIAESKCMVRAGDQMFGTHMSPVDCVDRNGNRSLKF